LNIDWDFDVEEARIGYTWTKCSWCGGYGYNFHTSDNAKRCEVCDGRKYVEKPIGNEK
jgi:DnaJ-class molecular chaperone